MTKTSRNKRKLKKALRDSLSQSQGYDDYVHFSRATRKVKKGSAGFEDRRAFYDEADRVLRVIQLFVFARKILQAGTKEELTHVFQFAADLRTDRDTAITRQQLVDRLRGAG